jgi:hypothetical protein
MHELACGRHQRFSSGAYSIVHYPNITFQNSVRSILSWSFQRRHTCGCQISGWAMMNFYSPFFFSLFSLSKNTCVISFGFCIQFDHYFFLLLFGLFLFFFLLISFFNFISHYLVWFDLNFKVGPHSFNFCLFLWLF